MKTKCLLFVALGWVSIACNTKNDPSLSLKTEIKVSFSQIETKTALENAETTVYCEPGDEIKMFSGKSTGKFTTDIKEKSATATFAGSMDLSSYKGSRIKAIYPYESNISFEYNDSSKDYTFINTLPSIQEGRAGSFPQNTLIAIAETEISDNINLKFRNICGGVRFSVSNTDIKSVSFEGLNGEVIAGEFELKSDETTVKNDSETRITLNAPDNGSFLPGKWYYIVSLPAELKNGFKLTIKNSNNTAIYFHGESVTVDRGVFVSVSEIDKGLVFFERKSDREALIDFYHSTNGDSWKNNDNWCSKKPINEWFGITAQNVDGKERVTGITLESNNLSGVLPSSIGNMDQIQYINLINNSITGKIPGTIANLSRLQAIVLSNNSLSGNIPESICNLYMLSNCTLDNNQLEGTLPEDIGKLRSLEDLLLNNNKLEGSIPESIGNLSLLSSLQIESNNLTGSIPSEITKLTNLFYISLSNNALEGTIPPDIGNLINLKGFVIDNNNINGNLPESMGGMNKLTGFDATGNKLSGFIPDAVIENINFDSWKFEPQQEGYGLDMHIYSSTDYSRDGEVRILQTATKGSGINLVLMGDAFCDTDIESGIYDELINTAVDAFFTNEPYRSMKDFFNIYEVTAVSKNNKYYSKAERTFDTYIGAGTNVGGNHWKVTEYAQKAIGNDDLDECTIVVIMNKKHWGGTSYYFPPSTAEHDNGRGKGIAYQTYGRSTEEFKALVQHEAGGHAFAKLSDEYSYSDFGIIPESLKQNLQNQYQDWGWWPNIDFTSSPESVKWNRYIEDSRYSSENIGVFEGGATYSYGVWKPTKDSMMKSSYGPFNAPSREAIYKRINSLAYGADWEFDYETFVAFDAPARQSTKAFQPKFAAPEEPLHSPVVVPENIKWTTE